MNYKRLFATALFALLPLTAGATTLVIPAAGTGAGANNSHWQTEVTLHNTSSTAATATLTFHDTNGASTSANVDVAPRATVSIGDVVATRFGRTSATGAIVVDVPNEFTNKLTVASRTFNTNDAGEFGQDIPAVFAANAPAAGDTIVLSGPTAAANARFNFGIYAVSATTVRWDLVRADGTIAASREATYAAGVQTQYNSGIESFFGQPARDNDTVQALITSGRAIAYGSAVNNASGDPTYVPGIAARADVRVNFVGVDFGGDGIVDVADANHDGVLDQSVEIVTGHFPVGFRIVVTATSGKPVFELVDAPADARLADDNGGIFWQPSTSGPTTLKVRVTADGVTDVITIPVNVR
jgi:hypothetical protein